MGHEGEGREARELYYKVAVKLLDLMLEREFLLPEEYAQIDRLNRESFIPELAGIYENAAEDAFIIR